MPQKTLREKESSSRESDLEKPSLLDEAADVAFGGIANIPKHVKAAVEDWTTYKQSKEWKKNQPSSFDTKAVKSGRKDR
jgi:hypothetical protein